MLTHIDQKNLPTMVDITQKRSTQRMAIAQASVALPTIFKDYIDNNELVLKKGPVIQTAIIAGTMAVKKTSELIPFCHQLPIESCKFDIKIEQNLKINIRCLVKSCFKTGVEMEALTGATIAALTIYDMCKALSHEIEIESAKLLVKTGGKRTIMDRPLYGLVLTGGKSSRMQEDKALIDYHGKPHAKLIYDLLGEYCEEVYLSGKQNQWKDTPLTSLKCLVDAQEYNGIGPIAGLMSAFDKAPQANWLVVACDLIHFNHETIEKLLSEYDSDSEAFAFKNKEKGFPEALCALYTPSAFTHFKQAIKDDIRCPVKVVKSMNVKLIDQGEEIDLANINTPDERSKVFNA